MTTRKILLGEEDLPKQWYNITPDLPKPLPPFIDPETKRPEREYVPRIFPREILWSRNEPRTMDKYSRRS